MILDKEIEVTIINHNIQYYRNLGYNVKCKDKIIVKAEELSEGSHYRINCKCDNCGKENRLKFQDYAIITTNLAEPYYCNKCVKELKTKFTLIKKYGVDNVSKSNIIKDKKKNTNIKNWGVENVFQSEIIKDKLKETNLERYGVEHFRQNEQIKEKEKEKRIKNGTQMPDELLSEFQLYKRITLYYTRKQVKNLYLNWNGLDYYDNELIKENKSLNSNDDNYPTIDHKISIKNGFENKIEPNLIGNLDNLCITKRCNNSSKGSLYRYPKRINK